MKMLQLDELLDFQSDEWEAGRRPSLESLLECNPELKANKDAILDLIYNEVILREQHRQRPQLSDYLSRFPQLAAELERQFEVHGVMGSSLPPVVGSTTPPESIVAGRYRTVAFHAAGGLGYVYRASDGELQRTVALKCMKERAGADSPLTKRFLQEAEITSLLEHPTIVPVHGSGITSDGRPYYAMRFVDGETLEYAAKRLHATKGQSATRNPGFRRLLRAIVDVSEAVAYAHSKNILHRDLKPANILLGAYGETLLLDWGLAKKLGELSEARFSNAEVANSVATPPVNGHSSVGSSSQTDAPATLTFMGKAKGSPAFMSPEQARGDWQQVGVASDVYSLGATLYYVLTGRLAYTAQTSHSVLEQVGKGEFVPPKLVDKQIPAALSAITCKAMALQPSDRYACAQDFAKDLERWMADEPVSAHVDSVIVRVTRWARRHRTFVAACFVGLIVASIGLAIGAWRVNVTNLALSQANEKESKQRELANTRFSQALDAQFSLITEIQNELGKSPGTRVIRERLVKEAMAKLEVLLKGAPEVEDVELAMISAHRALANLYENIDLNAVKAEEQYQKALRLAELFYQKHPESAAARQMKFEILIGKVNLDVNCGNLASAEEAIRKMTALLPNVGEQSQHAEALISEMKANLAQARGDNSASIKELSIAKQHWQAADSSNLDNVARLSKVLSALGQRHYLSGNYAEAEKEYSAALKQSRELARREPENVRLQADVANICQQLAGAVKIQDRHSEAESYYDQAITTYQSLVDKDPTNTSTRADLADVQSQLAGLFFDRGKLPDALPLVLGAGKVYEELLTLDPNGLRPLTDLAHARWREARIYDVQGEFKKAIETYEKAIENERKIIKLAPERASPRFDLAELLRENAQLRLEFLKDQEGGFKAFEQARMELDSLAKIDPANVAWQHKRLGTFYDIAYWKYALKAPGVESIVAEGMKEIAALPQSIQSHPEIILNSILLQRTLIREWIVHQRFDDAQRILEEQLKLLQMQKTKTPEEAFVWRELRNFEKMQADVCEVKQDLDSVIEHLRKSVAAGRELEKRFPDHDRQNQVLPQQLERLADKLVFSEPVEARNLIEEAIARYEQITPEIAARYQFTLMLGVKCLKLADLTALLRGNSREVIVAYQKAAEYFERSKSDEPQDKAVSAGFLAHTHSTLCENLLLLGDLEGARAEFDQVKLALEFAEPARLADLPVGKMAIQWLADNEGLFDFLPEALESHDAIARIPSTQRSLVMKSRIHGLIDGSKLEQAVNSIEWMVENSEGAGILADAAKQFGMLYEKSNRRNVMHKQRALELLRLAIEKGYFGEPGNRALCKLAPEFIGFSDSPEFKQLFEPTPADGTTK